MSSSPHQPHAAATADRRRTLLAPWAALAGVAGTWLAVAAVRPSDEGRVLCPWRALTGLDCPLCGSTRAAASLAHGDLTLALDHNALFVLALVPLAAVVWVIWVARTRSGRAVPMISNRMLMTGLAVLGGWWVLRLAVPWLGSGAAL